MLLQFMKISFTLKYKQNIFVLFQISISMTIQNEFGLLVGALHREKILGRKEKAKGREIGLIVQS